MSLINVQEQISNLINLQALDSEIHKLSKEKQEKPLEIEAIKKRFEDKKTHLKEIENTSKQLQVQLRGKETELLSKEEAIQKAQTQLYQIKTNKEYQAKMLEIEGIKADKSILEEVIIKILDEVDFIKVEVEKEKTNLAQEEKVFNQKIKQIEDRVKEIDQNLHILNAKREQVVPSVDKSIVVQYERILHNKDGLALVPIKDDSCQGCFMNVPPQVINEIKMKDRLVVCEVCARILYIEGEF